MKTIKVSVVVPIYNAAAKLWETLCSLKSQTFENLEIILVDDGSTDESKVIIQQFTDEDNRFHYYYKDNGGAGSARNYGIQCAHGDYIMFLDADDLFDPDLISKMHKPVECNEDIDIVICKSDQFNSKNKVIMPRQPDASLPVGVHYAPEYWHVLFQCFYGTPWDKLFKRSFILDKKLEFQELRYANDTYFVLSALAEAKAIYVMDDVLVHYRVDEGGSLRDNTHKDPYCDLIANNAVFERLQSIDGINEKNEILTSFRERCLGVVFNNVFAMSLKDVEPTRLLCQEYFRKYERVWNVNRLSYKTVTSKKMLWKYRRFRGCSFNAFLWACKGRVSNRSGIERGKVDKAVFALRLMIASVLTPSMAKSFYRLDTA